MARWTHVEVPWSEKIIFPNLCPGCLKTGAESNLRIRSDKGRLMGFYIVASKWQHLWITVPFCAKCAERRKRWESLDLALLLMMSMLSLVLAGILASLLSLPVWAFWILFFVAAVFLTRLCNRLVEDYRAVRIEGHDDHEATFKFSHYEYAREFARSNGRQEPFPSTAHTVSRRGR